MEKAASWLLARKRSLHDKRLARYKISLLSEVPAPDLGYFFRKGACLLEHVKAGRGIGCRYRVQAQAAVELNPGPRAPVLNPTSIGGGSRTNQDPKDRPVCLARQHESEIRELYKVLTSRRNQSSFKELAVSLGCRLFRVCAGVCEVRLVVRDGSDRYRLRLLPLRRPVHIPNSRRAHPQRSTSNQSPRDPAARDTIGLHSVRQWPGESVSEFCLPRLRLGRKERQS